jgi:TrmH family RNA methyltransferase
MICLTWNFKNEIGYPNLQRNLKENDYVIYGTNVVDGIDVKNVKNDRKYAIIMGNEGNGISSKIKEQVDKNIYIKMNENCESLNASVAASILLYEINNK